MSIKTGQLFIKLYQIISNYVKSYKIICFFFSLQARKAQSNIYGGFFSEKS